MDQFKLIFSEKLEIEQWRSLLDYNILWSKVILLQVCLRTIINILLKAIPIQFYQQLLPMMISVLHLFLFSSFVLAPALAQGCCAAALCAANSICFCNPDPVCASPVGESPTNFTITNNTSYFYYPPKYQKFSILQVVFCGQALPNVNNTLTIGIQTSEGSFPSTNKSYSFQTASQCATLIMTYVAFPKMSDGTRANLLMTLSLNAVASQNMEIFISGQQEYGSVLVPIVMAAVGVVVITAAIVLGAYIKRRCFPPPPPKPVNIDHLEKYMPAKKLRELGVFSQANCAICLQDLQSEDMARRTPCNHIYHSQCINDWCKKNLTCPICRVGLEQKDLEIRFRDSTRSETRKKEIWESSNIQRDLLDDEHDREEQQNNQRHESLINNSNL